MMINDQLLRQVESDLGLQVPFVRGQEIKTRNCWHFSTDGNAIDVIFVDDDDFVHGMNRIYVVSREYRIIILAFCLMDTHVHFILHGVFDECNRFVHEFIRRTSMCITKKHGEQHKLEEVPIHYQMIDTADYLKTAICYTIKNPPVASIPFNAYDYPWSSGALYFRHKGVWTSPAWSDVSQTSYCQTAREKRSSLKTHKRQEDVPRMIGDIVFPGEYVAYEVVERLFRSNRSFNFFMCRSREEDIDARGGVLSRLSIPMQEMRKHKNEVCKELFGVETVATLDITQRMRLARVLKSRYNSSLKQICRLSGLVYQEAAPKLLNG